MHGYVRCPHWRSTGRPRWKRADRGQGGPRKLTCPVPGSGAQRRFVRGTPAWQFRDCQVACLQLVYLEGELQEGFCKNNPLQRDPIQLIQFPFKAYLGMPGLALPCPGLASDSPWGLARRAARRLDVDRLRRRRGPWEPQQGRGWLSAWLWTGRREALRDYLQDHWQSCWQGV